jgi:hypothetical protein
MRAVKRVSGVAAGRNAKRVQRDGIWFDSAKEGNRYLHLKLLQQAGEIHGLELQPKYMIVVNGQDIYTQPDGVKGRKRLYYKADFRYRVTGTNQLVVEDVKGVQDRVYAIKKALVEAIYSIKITEV